MKVHTWILIADGSRAHIVVNEGIGKGLKAVATRELETSRRAPTRDLGTDRPGRGWASVGGGRHGIEPHVDWHKYEKHLFAESMAKVVNQAADRKAFDRLVLVAPPETLGQLRAALKPRTRKLVTAEVAKDLTHVAVHDLAGYLDGVVNV